MIEGTSGQVFIPKRTVSVKTNAVIFGIVALCLLLLVFGPCFKVGRFVDDTGASTTTMVYGANGSEGGLKLEPRWLVVLDGPEFFTRLAKQFLGSTLPKISGSPGDVEFSNELPLQHADGNVLFVRFEGKSFWGMFFSKYEDKVDWMYSTDGSTYWMARSKDTVFMGTEGPVMYLDSSIENSGGGLGLISYKANQSHRVAWCLDRIVNTITDSF